MNLYLIDYENVKNAGLLGIDRLDGMDRAVIFYSPNADMISFEMHRTLIESRCEIDFFKIKRGGKNFLDFQLATYLGFMMKESHYKNAVIISRDQGFDSLLDFWESGFAPTDTGLFRFSSIGSFLSYSAGLAAQKAAGSLEAAALETESEEIPEPVEEAESEAFKNEVTERIVTAEREHQKPTRGRRGRQKAFAAEKETTAPLTQEAVPQTESASEPQTEDCKTEQEEKTVLPEFFDKYPPTRQQELLETIRKCQRKGDLYITLIKDFGKKKGCEFYHELKGHFEMLKQYAAASE